MSKMISIFLLCCSFCFATTYYVDGNASGADNGTSWTDAWVALSSAGATANGDDFILVKNGFTYEAQDDATSAVLNCDNDVTAATPNIYIGCNGTGDETSYVAADVTIDASTNTLNYCIVAGDHTIFKNFILTGSAVAGIESVTQTDSNISMYNCTMHTCGTYGAYVVNDCIFVECTIYNNTHGISSQYGTSVTNCVIYDNTTNGIYAYSAEVSGSTFWGGTANHIQVLTINRNYFKNCTFDGEDDLSTIAIYYNAAGITQVPLIVNCVIYSCSVGLSSTTALDTNYTMMFNNLLNNNDSNTDGNIGTGSTQDGLLTVAPEFVAEASNNYLPIWSTASPLIDAASSAGVYGSIGSNPVGDLPALANVDSGDTVNSEAGTGSLGGGITRFGGNKQK